MGRFILILNLIWILIWFLWKPQRAKRLKIKRCCVNLIQWLAIIIQVIYLFMQIQINTFGDFTVKDDSLFGVIISTLILQLIIALTHTWSLFNKECNDLNNKIVLKLQPGTYEFSKNLDWKFASVGLMRLSTAIKYKDLIIKMPDHFSCTGEEQFMITCIPDKKNDQLYLCETYAIVNKEKIKKKWSDYLYQWMALANLCFIILWFLLGEGYAPEGTVEYQIFQLLILGVFGGWVSLITRGVNKNNLIPFLVKLTARFIVIAYLFDLFFQIGIWNFTRTYLNMLGFC